MRRATILAIVGFIFIAVTRSETWGRLALWAGLPGAEFLLHEPAARGLALYRNKQFAAADAAFAEAGRSQTFNRALSLAATGKFALSVTYFDAVLFANPADEEARRLRNLIDKLVPDNTSESSAPGRLLAKRAKSTPNQVNNGGLPGPSDPEWQRKVSARDFAASDHWLATLADDPGEFLRLRLLKEYERRVSLGLLRPKEANPL